MLALVNLKARFGWSDKSFTELVLLLKNMFPEHNSLPKSHYEAKKILCPVGLEYQRIHACPNDCLLYRNEFMDMRFCPTCGLSRYKGDDEEVAEETKRVSLSARKVRGVEMGGGLGEKRGLGLGERNLRVWIGDRMVAIRRVKAMVVVVAAAAPGV